MALRRSMSERVGCETLGPFDERNDLLMKGNAKLPETLNSLLADELTAISQYIVHGEICENWGYGKLHDHFRKRAVDEMKHAEALIARILFLEGRPVVS